MPQHFTLHVRLTRRCNADCDYCSSWREGEHGHMTLAQFERSARYLLPYFAQLGFASGRGQTLSVQYVGGEVLTVPTDELRAIVDASRSIFGAAFDHVVDGVQSNLIGSPARVAGLISLFGGRIGTSVDSFGSQRTLSGSASKYRVVSIASAQRLRRMKMPAAAIFVVDKAGLEHVMGEFEIAEQGGYPLTLRAVFNGGRTTHQAEPEDIARVYGQLFDRWALASGIPVEPFTHLLAQRLATHAGVDAAATEGCPFQSNCAEVSLNLDPNGDLFICLDTSDASQLQLGNALREEFDWELWGRIRARSEHLDASCASCDYRKECGGGCMSEGYHLTGDPFGKTGLCIVWKTLFSKIDKLIQENGIEAVSVWLKSITQKNTPSLNS